MMKGGQIPIFIVLFLSFSCVTLTKSERLDRHNVQRYLSALTQISGGGMEGFDLQRAAEFVVGKDRELIHASIDLKWLFDKVANRLTWIRVFESVVHRLRRIHPGYNAEVVYREQAHQIASDIYNIDPNSYNLRVFQHSIHTAQSLAVGSGRPILLYCEEESDDVIPSLPTFLMRRALASPEIASHINSNHIFMASYESHPYVQTIIKAMNGSEENPVLKPPFMVILHPTKAQNTNEDVAEAQEFLWDSATESAKAPTFLGQVVYNSLALTIGRVFSISDDKLDELQFHRFLSAEPNVLPLDVAV